jgi:hypothetical protein
VRVQGKVFGDLDPRTDIHRVEARQFLFLVTVETQTDDVLAQGEVFPAFRRNLDVTVEALPAI